MARGAFQQGPVPEVGVPEKMVGAQNKEKGSRERGARSGKLARARLHEALWSYQDFILFP